MDTGTLVDVVLAVLAVETAVLLLARRRFPRIPPWRDLVPNLAAGLFLVLALRGAVHGAGWMAIAAFMALGGVAHVVDLRRRTRS